MSNLDDSHAEKDATILQHLGSIDQLKSKLNDMETNHKNEMLRADSLQNRLSGLKDAHCNRKIIYLYLYCSDK